MFFVFDSKRPVQLIFYIILIIIAIVFEYLDIAQAHKVIGIGILTAIIIYVLKSMLGLCEDCKGKD